MLHGLGGWRRKVARIRTKVTRRRLVALVVIASTATLLPALPAEALVITTKAFVPVETSVDDPCTGELVQLSGEIRAVFLTSTEESGDLVVRYAFEAPGVHGEGETTGLDYLLLGEIHGISVGQHRDRAVTAADFEMLAQPSPGVEVSRASVTASFGFTIGFSGGIEQVSMNSLVVDKLDC
jgi:hypothetical protein